MKTKFLFAVVLLLNTVFAKSQTLSVSVSSDTTVCSGQSVQIVCLPSGGSAPYTYSWSPNGVFGGNPVVTPTSTTVYSVTVMDDLGATATDSVVVTVRSKPVIDSIIIQNAICGQCNGEATALVSGGSPPYMYQYIHLPNDIRCAAVGCELLCAGEQLLFRVTGSNGCKDSTVFTVGQQSSTLKIDSFITTNVSCFGGAGGVACVNVSGGTTPYNYLWSNQATGICINNLVSGSYIVTTADANGCFVIDTVEITEPPQLTAQLTSATGGILPDSLSVIVSGGTLPYNYLWSVFSGSPSIYVYNPDCYSVLVEDSKGCKEFSDTICYDCTNYCVWPGDADYDGVVNNNDLLPIGLTYGATGLARFQTDINWFGHPSLNWNDSLNDTLNYKHIDCDGNGIINANDTLAIIQNYNLTHPRNGLVRPHRANTPELAIILNTDTLADGETVVANLSLGSSAQPANNVYGIAFTFNYDANVVDTLQVGFVVNNNSWLCNNASDHISINKKFVQGGKIAVGITRIDKATRSGSGEIATAILKITTGNINGKDLSYYQLNTYISDVRAVDSAGNIIDINEGYDSAFVAFTPTGIRDIAFEQNSILLYPNPANNSIRFSLQNGVMEGWEIISVEGKTVLHNNEQTNVASTDVSQLAKGVYFLKINTKAGAVHGRFLKE